MLISIHAKITGAYFCVEFFLFLVNFDYTFHFEVLCFFIEKLAVFRHFGLVDEISQFFSKI